MVVKIPAPIMFAITRAVADLIRMCLVSALWFPEAIAIVSLLGTFPKVRRLQPGPSFVLMREPPTPVWSEAHTLAGKGLGS